MKQLLINIIRELCISIHISIKVKNFLGRKISHIYRSLDRLFVSLATASRLSTTDNGRIRSGRVSVLDTNTWSVERVLSDHNENFATCMTVHPDRQLLILGKLNNDKFSCYKLKLNLSRF